MTVGTVGANVRTGHLWTIRLPWAGSMRLTFAVWVMLALAVAGWATAGVMFVMSDRARQASEKLAAEAGLTPVAGPGVEIVISDATRPVKPGENPSMVLVQDSDLIFLNMMLWYGGARAVAINEERITAQSTITSSGPVIVINRRRIVGPFHVMAVGDPKVLQAVLETRGGFVDRMRQGGLGVQLTRQQHMQVPGRDASAM